MSDLLDELVLACLDRLEESGGDLEAALAPALSAHPEEERALRERLGALGRVGLVDLRGAPRDAAPERLGEYVLLRRLGGGGMGTVHLAEEPRLRRRVALKLLHPGDFRDPGRRARFRREAEAAARLAHPNIVPVYAFGEEGGVPYLAMEYVRGSSLDRVVADVLRVAPDERRGRTLLEAVLRTQALEADEEPPVPDEAFFAGSLADVVVRIALAVARALAHAHARGVLQRDVKPSNVMLTADGRVLLLDFGLSSLSGSERVTRSGALLGSLPYMAPEQLRGEEGDARTDVYGLGVTMYELLSGQPPYFADGHFARTHALVLEGRPPGLAKVRPPVPRDVQAVCLVAMERDAARRYESAQALVADLENVLARRPIHARPAGLLVQLDRWARRRPGAAAAVALALLVAVGGPAGYAWQAERARARLELEVERADRAFARSLDALDLVERVALDTLVDVPMAEDGRRTLLEAAVAFYRQLEADAQGAEGGRAALRRADALAHLGRALEGLGRRDEARAAIAEALGVYDAEGVAPGHPRASERGQAHWTLARLEAGVGRWQPALDAYADVLALWPAGHAGADGVRRQRIRAEVAQVHRQRGDSARARAEFAALVDELEAQPLEEGPELARLASWCLGELAQVDSGASDAERRRQLERALVLHELVVRHDPEDRSARYERVIALSNLGGLLVHSSDPADTSEAERLLVEAHAEAGRLVEDFPGLPEYRYSLAGVLLNLGAIRFRWATSARGDGDLSRPLGHFRRAAELLDRLVADAPDVVDYRAHRMDASINLASALTVAGEHAEALAELERVGPQLDAYARLRPGDATIPWRRTVCAMQRLRASLALGRIEDACWAAEELRATGDAGDLVEGARRLAPAALDASLAELSRESALEAVAMLLGEAARRGESVASWRTDPALAEVLDAPLLVDVLAEH